MKYRILTKAIEKAKATFPALVITGPRQSGKTTLLRNLFRDTHSYCNLEDPDTRMRAKEDPRGFLGQFEKPVVLDEIQYVPELLPYIKTDIDEQRKAGKWILTGSQNFTLMRGVSESLAGRVAVLSLLPFSFAEQIDKGEESLNIISWLKNLLLLPKGVRKISSPANLLLRGAYPEIASRKAVDKDLWCSSYISTYIERDIRNLSQVGDLSQFERFLRLCAIRTGQILSVSELSREVGVSVPTARRWLSLLETGYQIYLLYPFYRNLGKRLVKSPKLYFADTALACYLLGLREPNTLLNSPHFPHIFESFVVMDLWKRFLHFGQIASLYYLKTRDGLEIDAVLEINQKLFLFEIKASATIASRHAASLIRAKRDLGKLVQLTGIISLTPDSFRLQREIYNYRWEDILSL